MSPYTKVVVALAVGCLLSSIPIAGTTGRAEAPVDRVSADLVLVEGGTFEMGDVFGEGRENERPVHRVTLHDFLISRREVTVGQFKAFCDETGYRTSAEAPDDARAREEIGARFAAGNLSRHQMQDLKRRLLEYSGAGYWDARRCVWTGYDPATDWKNPGIEQTDADPVLAVSVVDAMHFCNWLSRKAGLPVAYDPETGDILDREGDPTRDVTVVAGYRLPTEAEWEYAARERGRKVRFGNGSDIARSAEINFRGDEGEYHYLEPGGYVGRSTPVGSFTPNSLGLYDMSGNAWEWVSDRYTGYTDEARVDPYVTEGDHHALRGGRWGGDAFEARVFHRSSWPRNDRCNNSGFRIARSAGRRTE